MIYYFIISILLAIIIIAFLFFFLRKRMQRRIQPSRFPRFRIRRKRRELRDIDSEIGREIVRLKMMKPSRKKEISIEPLLKKRRKKT